jgi:Flp pilus assembly protein TadG
LITLPVLMLLAVLVVAIGWLVTGQNAVRSAASEAARVASLSRSAGEADRAARAAAQTTLDNSDLRCRNTEVRVDTAGFAVAVGQDATVEVTVACEVSLSEYGLPGLGDRTVTATVTSALDTYRER